MAVSLEENRRSFRRRFRCVLSAMAPIWNAQGSPIAPQAHSESDAIWDDDFHSGLLEFRSETGSELACHHGTAQGTWHPKTRAEAQCKSIGCALGGGACCKALSGSRCAETERRGPAVV